MAARWAVWGALLASQALMLAVALAAEPGNGEAPAVLGMGLGVLAAVQAVVADLFFRRALRGWEQAVRAPAPDAPVLPPAAVIAWALDDAIGVYGLVLAWLGLPASSWGGFSVVAVVLLVLHRPRG